MRLSNITEIINKKVYYNKYKRKKDTLNIYLRDILIYKGS